MTVIEGAVNAFNNNHQKQITKQGSSILRGIAMLVVLINHYISNYTTLYGGGVANVAVSIFFVLSGYGIAASLERRLGDRVQPKKFLMFYKVRAFKVFPLLWVALALQSIVTQKGYPFTSYMGYELSGHYWFISSLLECYLLGPFLYTLMSRRRAFMMFFMTNILIFSLFSGNRYLTSESLTPFLQFSESPYLGIHFMSICLFFYGMCLWKFWHFSHDSVASKKSLDRYSLPVFIVIVSSALVYSLLERLVYTGLPVVGSLVLFFVCCAYTLKTNLHTDNITAKAIVFVGEHSFPIYLFHMSCYFFLERIGLFRINSVRSIFFCIVLFPVFILFALMLEVLANYCSTKMIEAT